MKDTEDPRLKQLFIAAGAAIMFSKSEDWSPGLRARLDAIIREAILLLDEFGVDLKMLDYAAAVRDRETLRVSDVITTPPQRREVEKWTQNKRESHLP